MARVVVLIVLAFVPHLEFANFNCRLFWCCVCVCCNATSCQVLHLSTLEYQCSPGPLHSLILVATSWPLCSADKRHELRLVGIRTQTVASVVVCPFPQCLFNELFNFVEGRVLGYDAHVVCIL